MKKIRSYFGYLIGAATLLFVGSMAFIRSYDPTKKVSTDILGLEISDGVLQFFTLHFWLMVIVGITGILLTWFLVDKSKITRKDKLYIKAQEAIRGQNYVSADFFMRKFGVSDTDAQNLKELLYKEGSLKSLLDPDQLYEEAKKAVIDYGAGSTGFLQRTLKIDYPRAAMLIDELFKNGIIEAADGAQPRKIIKKYRKV